MQQALLFSRLALYQLSAAPLPSPPLIQGRAAGGASDVSGAAAASYAPGLPARGRAAVARSAGGGGGVGRPGITGPERAVTAAACQPRASAVSQDRARMLTVYGELVVRQRDTCTGF